MLPTRLNLINFFSQLCQVVDKFTYNQPIFNYYVRSINQPMRRRQPTKKLVYFMVGKGRFEGHASGET